MILILTTEHGEKTAVYFSPGMKVDPYGDGASIQVSINSGTPLIVRESFDAICKRLGAKKP